MSKLREAAQQALEAIRIFREWETGQDYESCRATVLARALAAEESLGAALAEPEQDAELSAALGWPGGISTPILDRHVLLDLVAKQRSAALEEPQEMRVPMIGACQACGHEHEFPQREPQEPDAYRYALGLASSIWSRHYKDTAPGWKPLDDLVGLLSQIDNMVAGLVRQEKAALAEQPEPPPESQTEAEQRSYTFGWFKALEKSREMQEALQIIATPQRPDGTWNRDREACRQLAAEALGFHNKGGQDE